MTTAQFRRAFADGIHALPGAPKPLRDFFAVGDTVPDWVDFDLINEGGRVSRRFGRNSADVLLQLALIGSYRFGGPVNLLVETGSLTGATARRRLAETQHWAYAITGHDAMRRNGEGFRLTMHVRLMHALVNHQFEVNGRWDTARWGLPVNQSDLAGPPPAGDTYSAAETDSYGSTCIGTSATMQSPSERFAGRHLHSRGGWPRRAVRTVRQASRQAIHPVSRRGDAISSPRLRARSCAISQRGALADSTACVLVSREPVCRA